MFHAKDVTLVLVAIAITLTAVLCVYVTSKAADRSFRKRSPLRLAFLLVLAIYLVYAESIFLIHFVKWNSERDSVNALRSKGAYCENDHSARAKVDRPYPYGLSWVEGSIPRGLAFCFDRVTEVSLAGSSCSGDDLSLLESFEYVQKISLGPGRIDGADLRLLPHLSSLRILGLGGVSIAGNDLASLLSHTQISGLDLRGATVTDIEVVLTDVGRMGNLEMLLISHMKLPNGKLGRRESLQRLEILSLDDTNLSNEGLLELSGLASLHSLHIRGTRVTESGVSEYLKRCPSVDVKWR